VGVASVLLAGWLSDRLGLNGRSLLLFLGLTGTAAALLVLMSVRSGPSGGFLAVVVIGSSHSACWAVLLSGRRVRARLRRQAGERVRLGIIDGIGYLGGVLAGDTVARLSSRSAGGRVRDPGGGPALWPRCAPAVCTF